MAALDSHHEMTVDHKAAYLNANLKDLQVVMFLPIHVAVTSSTYANMGSRGIEELFTVRAVYLPWGLVMVRGSTQQSTGPV
jgi:hypothetical protein